MKIDYEIILCKEYMDFLLNQFPHLSEAEINYIFKYAKIKDDENDYLQYEQKESKMFRKQRVVILPEEIAKEHKIDIELPLITDEHGISWTLEKITKKDDK